MSKKLLAVIAHPDDETFGFGGTLAKYASEGVEIHVLCATRGEEGGNKKATLGRERERELLSASKILGVTRVEFMDFIDGRLCNIDYQPIAQKITAKITQFKPEVVITFDKLGVSGHIDHIAIALITTFVMKKYNDKIKFYYFAELKDFQREMRDYFIYIPPGYDKSEIDVVIDTKKYYDIQVRAMHEHKSQLHDVDWILNMRKNKPRVEHFIEVFKGKKSTKKQIDLFS
jgi:LmbE family N-acetylglucosaminyl deacetylase